MMSGMRMRIVLGTVVLLPLGAASAWAQDRNVIEYDEVEVIRGEVDKPEAFYILAPSNLNYQSIEPEESFLEELYETTRDDPFK